MQFPALHGNWVDLLIILITLFYLWEGISRGFLLGILDVGGFVLSFVASLKLYGVIGKILIENFSLPKGIANAVGFLIAGFVAEFIFSRLIIVLYKKGFPKLVGKLQKTKLVNKFFLVDRLLGVVPALGESLIFTAFILTLFVTLPMQGYIKKDIVSSKIGGSLVARTQGIERELNGIFGQAASETLTFITINPNPSSSEKVDLRFTTADVKVDEAAEETMFSLVNSERESRGLRGLSFSAKLRDVARAHAKDMFARGYFSHYNPDGQSPFDRMKAAGITFTAAGENLALAPNVSLAHQGLMNSPGHRANILSPDFGRVGIGVMDGGIYGEMFVQEFTD